MTNKQIAEQFAKENGTLIRRVAGPTRFATFNGLVIVVKGGNASFERIG